jgi:hypothetical protein
MQRSKLLALTFLAVGALLGYLAAVGGPRLNPQATASPTIVLASQSEPDQLIAVQSLLQESQSVAESCCPQAGVMELLLAQADACLAHAKKTTAPKQPSSGGKQPEESKAQSPAQDQ